MRWHLILMISMYIIGGVIHLLKPKVYIPALPPLLKKNALFWVYISGVFEILLAILCLFESTRVFGLMGIILMLIVFLWVHIYMIQDSNKFNIPNWVLWARLPLQFVLMYWAYSYM